MSRGFSVAGAYLAWCKSYIVRLVRPTEHPNNRPTRTQPRRFQRLRYGQQGGHMNPDGSISNSDSIYIVELLQKIRRLKLDVSGIIERNQNSKLASSLIMASGLLDGAMEELSKCISKQRG